MIALQEYPSETLQRILKELNFISWGIDYLITTSQFPLTEEKQALQEIDNSYSTIKSYLPGNRPQPPQLATIHLALDNHAGNRRLEMKAREQTITIEWSLNPDNVPGEVTVTITQPKDTEPIFQYTTELPTHDEVYAWAEQSR